MADKPKGNRIVISNPGNEPIAILAGTGAELKQINLIGRGCREFTIGHDEVIMIGCSQYALGSFITGLSKK